MVSISIEGFSATQKRNNCTKIYPQSCLEVILQKFKYVNIQMHNRRIRSHIHYNSNKHIHNTIHQFALRTMFTCRYVCCTITTLYLVSA